jgi:alkylation response protein AidB-like acyl-CoA dehydrogenase
MSSISTPDDPALDALCEKLCSSCDDLDSDAYEALAPWPAEQLRLCGEAGVYRWFLPRAWGGLEWSEADCIRGYLRLSAACLTTTFIITQRTGGCRRIADSANEAMKTRWLPGLADGSIFATVGISHLTTSRRHLSKPVLQATETADGFVLDGFSPWVTGGDMADCIVTGGTLDDGRQILVAVPTDARGVKASKPAKLVGLSASHTGEVRFDHVVAPSEWVIAGPVEGVMKSGGAATGGLNTSTLALGLASAAIDYLDKQSEQRSELTAPAESLRAEWQTAVDDLLAAAEGNPKCTSEDIRASANALALRSSQAALTAAKGSGYVVGHPAGRWCREALFFLVWSCPAPVMNATLCELAGLGAGD